MSVCAWWKKSVQCTGSIRQPKQSGRIERSWIGTQMNGNKDVTILFSVHSNEFCAYYFGGPLWTVVELKQHNRITCAQRLWFSFSSLFKNPVRTLTLIRLPCINLLGFTYYTIFVRFIVILPSWFLSAWALQTKRNHLYEFRRNHQHTWKYFTRTCNQNRNYKRWWGKRQSQKVRMHLKLIKVSENSPALLFHFVNIINWSVQVRFNGFYPPKHTHTCMHVHHSLHIFGLHHIALIAFDVQMFRMFGMFGPKSTIHSFHQNNLWYYNYECCFAMAFNFLQCRSGIYWLMEIKPFKTILGKSSRVRFQNRAF